MPGWRRAAFNGSLPLPPVPPLIPPREPDRKPGEGGFTPARPMPPLPGVDLAPERALVLSGPALQEATAIVLEQWRNAGLPTGAETYSERARRAAEVADPAVTQVLKGSEWESHHLINIAAIRGNSKLFAGAVRAGWQTDDPSNVVSLPASPEAAEKLRAAGLNRPVHDSGHASWNEVVEEKVKQIIDKLRADGLTADTSDYDAAAKAALKALQKELLQRLTGMGRVTEAQPTAVAASG